MLAQDDDEAAHRHQQEGSQAFEEGAQGQGDDEEDALAYGVDNRVVHQEPFWGLPA